MRRASAVAGPAALLVVAAAWTFVSAGATGGSAAGPAGVLVAAAATLVAAASVSTKDRWIVPALVVAGAVVVAVAWGGDVLSSKPAHGPFSYANATGAFYVQAATAGLMLVVAAQRRWGAWLGAACAAGFGAIVVASGSRAAAALLAVPVAAFIAAKLGAGRIAVRALAGALAIVALATVVLGAMHEPGPRASRGVGTPRRAERVSDRVAERIPDDRRLGLWHDALTLLRDNPVAGVGPGRFAEESPIASADLDARWAHHGFLQFGAETGLPGLALLTVAFAWAIGAVGFRGKPEFLSVLGVAALVALGAGGCLDYLFHFPAIPLTAAALAGAATNETTTE